MTQTLRAARPRPALDRGLLQKELNEKQFEAVMAEGGPILILAGAGSGKTRVITYRIARLIAEGASPGRVMALTFTNKAAAEMKERALALTGTRGGDIWISTFHSACLRMLRRDAGKIGYQKDFSVYDAQDQKRLIKSCLDDLGLPEKLHPARQMAAMISSFKNKLKGPEQAEKELNPRRHAEFLRLFHLYEKRLREASVMDFDDLLGRTVELLRREEAVRSYYRERFLHLLVDEFQDTNTAQYEIIRLIVGDHRNICVVGDDDQSIYRWRGANIGNILNFEKDYPDTKVILLERNYRSTQKILEAAGAVVARNPGRKPKKLWTSNAGGENIRLYRAFDEGDEARYVAKTINKLLDGGASLNDFAVFYRTNSQSRAIEDVLRGERIPYQIYGGLKFYERREVKDILAYFRAVLNPLDAVSFKRIINTPPRGIGAATIEKLERAAEAAGAPLSAMLDDLGGVEGLNAGAVKKLEAFREIFLKIRSAAQNMTAADALNEALTVTGYMDWLSEDKSSESQTRMENLTELVSAAEEFQEREGRASIAAFLDQAALVAEADGVDEGSGAVKLMTIHVSKGLEFPIVFVTGLEDGLFPHARSKDDPSQMEEERRLMYVAMTRAGRRLFITHTEARRMFGVTQVSRPSPFLRDLPPEVLEQEGGEATLFAAPVPRSQKPRPAPAATTAPAAKDGELAVGAKARHPSFGVGIVRKIEGRGDGAKVVVYFPRFGERKLVRKFAKLEII
ncbi:MAG: ATP-dependent helicase [Candidatus Nitrospinota bacterium M3_3B_026]